MDSGEFARTCQAGEVLAVAPVGLDVIARSPRNQRGRSPQARMSERSELAVNPESARPRLVHEHECTPTAGELAHRLQQGNPIPAHCAETAYLALFLRQRGGDRFLV